MAVPGFASTVHRRTPAGLPPRWMLEGEDREVVDRGADTGEWLSSVELLLWGQAVGGSNPPSPTGRVFTRPVTRV